MATFEHRSGAWRARIIRRPLGIDESATFPTKAQAVAWATTREAEILAGARGLPSKHTVADAIDKFILEVCPHRKGERWERIRLTKFRKHKLALRPISKVTSADMALWRDERLGQVSPSSVAREMNLWGALFTIAVREWRWISTNPIRGVRRPVEPPARRRGVQPDEISVLVKKLNGPAGLQVASAFLLSLETGMRCGEILGLTWDHVNLAEGYVTLPKTKNGDSRQVPLSLRAAEILNQVSASVHPEPNGGGELRDGVSTGIAKRVFTITGATLDVLFRRARDAAVKDCPSVATLHFHDARGEAITRLSRKLDILELARVAGHRKLSSLLHYYRATASEIAKKLD